MAPNCPKCGSATAGPPKQEWNFSRYHVTRFECVCGDKFNFYLGGKNGGFTIPRPIKQRTFCLHCKIQNPMEAVYCKNCGIRLHEAGNA